MTKMQDLMHLFITFIERQNKPSVNSVLKSPTVNIFCLYYLPQPLNRTLQEHKHLEFLTELTFHTATSDRLLRLLGDLSCFP